MLPVSAWPPGPPGASLSPFGPPKCVNVGCCKHGYVLPKGAWVVQTGANQVVMFRPDWKKALYNQPQKQMGTGYLPGYQQWRQGHRPPVSAPTVPVSPSATTRAAPTGTSAVGAAMGRTFNQVPQPTNPGPWVPPLSPPPFTPGPQPCQRMTHDEYLEKWRAWQRRTGNTDPPIRPLPGRVPPNFAGWWFVGAPSTVLIPSFSGGTVLGDGQNVVIAGGGFANITQAYSV